LFINSRDNEERRKIRITVNFKKRLFFLKPAKDRIKQKSIGNKFDTSYSVEIAEDQEQKKIHSFIFVDI